MPGSFYRRLRGFGNDIGIRRTALNRQAEMPARNQAGVVARQAGPADIGAQRIDGTAGGAADLAGQRVAAVVGAAHAAVVIIDQRRRDTGDGCVVFQSEARRSEEHTSELQSLMRISYAVFCLRKK